MFCVLILISWQQWSQVIEVKEMEWRQMEAQEGEGSVFCFLLLLSMN